MEGLFVLLEILPCEGGRKTVKCNSNALHTGSQFHIHCNSVITLICNHVCPNALTQIEVMTSFLRFQNGEIRLLD